MKLIFALSSLLILAPVLALGDQLTPQEQVKIYAIVVQRLLGPDDTYDDPMPSGKIYIQTSQPVPPSQKSMEAIIKVDDARHATPPAPPPPLADLPDYFGSDTPPSEMNKQTEGALQIELKSLHYDFHWIPGDSGEIKFDKQNGSIIGGGALLTISQVESLSEDKIYLSGTIYVAREVIGTCFYIFKKENGAWHLDRRIWGPIS